LLISGLREGETKFGEKKRAQPKLYGEVLGGWDLKLKDGGGIASRIEKKKRVWALPWNQKGEPKKSIRVENKETASDPWYE